MAKTSPRIFVAGVTAALLVAPPAAVAQKLEEIVVTATKREISAQTVPIPLTGLSAEQIERLGQIVDGLGDGVVHVRHQLDGVAQELLRQPGSLPGFGLDRVEDDRSGVRQIPRRLVDQRDLPFHTERGTRRTGKLDRHTQIQPQRPRDREPVAGAL